jgi:hypothetical protein
MARSRPSGFPPKLVEDAVTNKLIIALFTLYVAELFAWAFGAPLGALVWSPMGSGRFAPWQPLTHFLVQGQPAVVSVVLSLLILSMLVPQMRSRFSDRELAQGMGAGAGAGVLLAFVLDLIGMANGGAMGWLPLVEVLLILWGLNNPNDEIRIYFIFPVTGRNFVWGLLVVALLMYLAGPSLQTAQGVGTWLGTWAWWRWRLGRRDSLRRQAASVESQLRNLKVLPGGRQAPPRGQGGQDVH